MEALNSSHVRIMKLFFLLLLFAHWNACLIYLVATLDSLERSWVADNHLLDADNSERCVALRWACQVAARVPEAMPEAMVQLHCFVQPPRRYSIALFNSLSHMLCIGYGRTAPGVRRSYVC